MFRNYSLGRKKRPVLILSSASHNRMSDAALLVVPFTTKYPNSALNQWKTFPGETSYRSVITRNSILPFNYSSFVECDSLEAALDSLRSETLIGTIQ